MIDGKLVEKLEARREWLMENLEHPHRYLQHCRQFHRDELEEVSSRKGWVVGVK